MSRIGRNDPCSCGSGKKYKKCCGKNNVISFHNLLEKDALELQQVITAYTMDNFGDELSKFVKDEVEFYDFPEELDDIVFSFVASWVAFTTPLAHGKTAISSFIEGNRYLVKRPQLKSSLPDWENAYPYIYKVQAINSEKEVVVQPIDEERKLTVLLDEEDEGLLEGSLLLGILVPIGEMYTFFITYLDASPNEEKAIDARLRIFMEEEKVEDLKEYIEEFFVGVLELFLLEGVNPQNLEWQSPQHQMVAKLFEETMRNDEMPEEIMFTGILLWHLFCQKRDPIIKKPNLYVAALHYLIEQSIYDFSGVTQKELAEKYNVSPNSLSTKYRELEDVLADELDELESYVDVPEGLGGEDFLLEEMLRDVERTLEGKDFASEEEMEDFLEQLVDKKVSLLDEPSSKKDKAQDLLYKSQGKSMKEKIQLAKRALEIYPKSPDAYIILGEAELLKGNQRKALAYFEKGMKVGAEDLGEDFFNENVGSFWVMISTRPYMRATYAVGELLLETGEIQQAIGYFEKLLELNENDNQGVRYLLFKAYVLYEDIKAAQQLLDKYEEPTAMHYYNNLLLELIREGISKKAKKLFNEAKEANGHVLTYLLNEGDQLLPPPDSFALGSEEEAVLYEWEYGDLWDDYTRELKSLVANAKSALE